MHSVLSNWHTEGRYLPKQPSKPLRFIYGLLGMDYVTKLRAQRNTAAKLKPKHPLAVQLSHLPEAQRVKEWQRLDAQGAFSGNF